MLKRYTYRRRNSLCVLLFLHTVLLFMHFSLLLLLLLPSLSPMACMAQTMALYECGGIGVGSHRINHAWSRPGRHLPTCSVHQSVCMCKCMYVQMYVCMCKFMYCVSVLMFKCMYCTNVCMYKCMYVCASVCMCKHRISMVQACVLGCCCTHLQCIERRLLLAISLLVYLVW